MSELIIFNCKLNQEIIKRIENQNKSKKIYCLNFSNNFFNFKSRKFIEINQNIKFQKFCKIKIGEIFEKIKKQKIFDEFWTMKVSEFNLADNFWINFFRKEYISDLIKIKKINKIYFFTDIKEYSLNQCLSDLPNIKYIYIKKNFLKKKFLFQNFFYLSILIIKLKNLIYEIKNLILLKFSKKKNIKSKNIFFANFPDHFDENLNISYYKNNNFFFYYVSLIRGNKNLLNSPKLGFFNKLNKNKNFDFIERYISLTDIFNSYFCKNSFTLKNKIQSNLNKIGIHGYLENYINYYYRNVELPKLLVYEKGIKSTLNKIGNKKKINYGYFEFTEGRVMTNILKKENFNSLALQHGFVGFFQKIRCFDVFKVLNKSFIPKKIRLLQKITLNKKKYNEKINFLHTNLSKKKKDAFSYSTNLNFLLFSDLHNIKSYDSFLKLSKKLKNIKIYFRPHPKNIKYYKKFFKMNKFNNIFLDEEKNYDISITKYKINCILISSYTGVLNQIYNKYWPILILNFKNHIPNINCNNRFYRDFVIENLGKVEFVKYFSKKMRSKFLKSINI
ncbi:hypothetical protein [Candidatus Pelagibacter sp. HIMB1782]|uniref:hypothetical protein n=1 Tax=Candidatus Pelagibacter sp. HIMB1782 TaxID=3413375 RepID=UPI003F8424B9